MAEDSRRERGTSLSNRVRLDADKPVADRHQYSDARRQSGAPRPQSLAQPRGNHRSSTRKMPPTGYIAGTHCQTCRDTKKRLVKHSPIDCPLRRSSAPHHERAYSATVSNELCYTTTADVDVEYVPNVRRASTHRVDLTRPERRSITVRAPRRRTTAHLPFVDSDPFSHHYTSSPYVGANSDEEKASNESDAEDEDGERSE